MEQFQEGAMIFRPQYAPGFVAKVHAKRRAEAQRESSSEQIARIQRAKRVLNPREVERRERVRQKQRAIEAMKRDDLSAYQIMKAVAEMNGLTVDDMIGPSRTKRIVTIRHEAMCEVRARREMSFPRIGKLFGGRDHTTVLHGVKKHQKALDEHTGEVRR